MFLYAGDSFSMTKSEFNIIGLINNACQQALVTTVLALCAGNFAKNFSETFW
jgi:hypothetical protein